MSSVSPLQVRSGVNLRTRSAIDMSKWQLNRVKIEWAVVAAEDRATGGHWRPPRARCAHEGGIQHESLHETKRSALRFDAPGVQSLPHGASDTRHMGGARSVPSRQMPASLASVGHLDVFPPCPCLLEAVPFFCLFGDGGGGAFPLPAGPFPRPPCFPVPLPVTGGPFMLRKCPTSDCKNLPSLEPKWPHSHGFDEEWTSATESECNQECATFLGNVALHAQRARAWPERAGLSLTRHLEVDWHQARTR